MFTIVIVLLLGILLIYIYLHKRIAIHQKEEKLTRLALQLHDKELEVEKNESYIAELQSQFEQNNKKEELYVEQVEALKKLKRKMSVCRWRKICYMKRLLPIPSQVVNCLM